jgi:hypothetical protein
MLLKRLLHDFILPIKVISNEPMVFPCGISRSGTTLLATIFDAHSKICLGYELLPPPLPGVETVLKKLQEGMKLAEGDFARVGSQLRKGGDQEIGQWLSRVHRAGATSDDVEVVLKDLLVQRKTGLTTIQERLRVCAMIVSKPQKRSGAVLSGFKFSGHRFDDGLLMFPNASFVYILRDPRDIVVSMREREFDRTLSQVTDDWNRHLHSFEEFAEKHPKQAVLIRYEDLVSLPNQAIEKIFSVLPVDPEPAVYDFQNSKATVLNSRHPNTENLKKGFFTDSIGRWKGKLESADVTAIEHDCGHDMLRHGYELSTQSNTMTTTTPVTANTKYPTYKLPWAKITAQKLLFSRRRNYKPADYQALLDPYIKSHESLRLRDYVREKSLDGRKILIIRHDVDHDHLTAVKIAKWERERGLNTTYCLLHTAWYYGEFKNGHYHHTQDVLDAARQIVDLGHEVNFHNNLVTLALTEGIDPAALLREELDFFRSNGVPVVGTSTHGDGLCRELNFRNWELFKECCDDRFGGPRTVTLKKPDGKESSIELGKFSMFDFGLEYEAYDIARDLYHTDSGGNLRLRENTRGRKDFGRSDKESSQVVGVLTHPIWWDFPD